MTRRILLDITPLRESRDFARIWFGSCFANTGMQITVVAVGLEIYHLTHSTLAVGVLSLFALVPLVGLGLYGGALVDVHDRRTVALIASLVMWVSSMGIAAHAWLQMESVWVLYILVAIQSAASAVNSPARAAITPRIIRAELLPAANALMALLWNIALLAGPMIGSLLVALVGFGPTYTIDVITFMASLYALIKLPKIPPLPSEDPSKKARRGWRGVMDGLRYLNKAKNLRMTFFIDMCAMVLAQPRVIFPAVGALMIGGGATTTGALTAAIAAGSIIAGVFSGPLGRIRAQGKAVAIMVALWGIAITALGIVLVRVGHTAPSSVLWWALILSLVVLAVAGFADSISMVFRNTMLQSAAPDDIRGRLQGVFTVVVTGGPRLGDMVTGANSSLFGEGGAVIIGGIACVIAVIALMRWQPSFLKYDSRDPQA